MAPGHTLDGPDAELLGSLFDPSSPFRHRMGLRRCGLQEFYAATWEGPSIREEKRQILDAEPELYGLSSEAGTEAAQEFARLLAIPDFAAADFHRNLSLSIEPDLMFVRPPDWSLTWASVCFPTRWSLEGKLHKPLSQIHAAVPELNEQLGRQITTFFDRLKPGEGWRRANGGLTATTQRNQHPSVPIRVLDSSVPAAGTFIRIEDQHFAKLVNTRAIAFGIRIVNFRLSDALEIPGVREGLLEKLRTMPRAVGEYKSIAHLLDVEQ